MFRIGLTEWNWVFFLQFIHFLSNAHAFDSFQYSDFVIKGITALIRHTKKKQKKKEFCATIKHYVYSSFNEYLDVSEVKPS